MNIFNQKSFEPFLWFIYAGAVATALCFLVYAAVQQNYRQSLNDPQIQIAEDIKARLEVSGAILDQIPTERVVIQNSPAPFVIIYDTEGNPIAGNGFIGNNLLNVPKGVFNDAKAWGENRRTLEPQNGVRIASVVLPFVGREANGYVLVGRNMREVEARIGILTLMIAFVWAVTIGGLFVLSCLLWFLRRE